VNVALVGILLAWPAAAQHVPSRESDNERCPGIFRAREGHLRTAEILGPGLGIRDEWTPRL